MSAFNANANRTRENLNAKIPLQGKAICVFIGEMWMIEIDFEC